MESNIVKNLKPEFEPVAIVWSNTIPDDTFQFKKDKSGCILYLFAEASSGKNSGGGRDNVKCIGDLHWVLGMILLNPMKYLIVILL